MSMVVALWLAAQAPAAVPDWRVIGEHQELVIAWDAGSIVRSGELTQVRIRLSPKSPTQADKVTSISRIDIRCADGTARVAETANYFPDGRAGPGDKDAQPFEPIPPNSFFATVRTAVCPARPERG